MHLYGIPHQIHSNNFSGGSFSQNFNDHKTETTIQVIQKLTEKDKDTTQCRKISDNAMQTPKVQASPRFAYKALGVS